MELKEDVKEIREEVTEMSFAMEMINFVKEQTEKTNKRLFAIIIVLIICLGLSVGYNIYLLNDISTVETETTQEVSDVETVEGNIVNNGDIYGKDKTDSKNKKEN